MPLDFEPNSARRSVDDWWRPGDARTFRLPVSAPSGYEKAAVRGPSPRIESHGPVGQVSTRPMGEYVAAFVLVNSANHVKTRT